MIKILIFIFLLKISDGYNNDSLVIQNRIMGGVLITAEDAPYQATILIQNSSLLCGGSIITPTLIVTAGHCVADNVREFTEDKSTTFVVTGITFMDEINDSNIFPIAKTEMHPNYGLIPNIDIAIIILKRSITFGPNVKAIPLCSPDFEYTAETIVRLTGFGKINESGPNSKYLRMIEVPIVNHDTCKLNYKHIIKMYDQTFCAGLDIGGKDTCYGDSGGPVVYNKMLIGVVSFGLGCGYGDKPGVYAKISSALPFIQQFIQ